MTRSNRRPLAGGALAACAVVATGLLSACGAGQIAQTAQVAPAVPGANAQASGYAVYLRDVLVDYRQEKGYPAGASATISLWIFNSTEQPVRLAGVTAAQQAGGQSAPVQVVLSDGSAVADASAATSASTPPCVVPRSLEPSAPRSPTSPSPTPVTGSAAASARGSASAGAGKSSASPSAPPSASPSPSPAGATTIDLTIPAGGCVELSRRAAHYLQVVSLPQPLGNADTLQMTFQFSTADGQSFTVGDPQNTGQPLPVPVGVPASALPRASNTAR